MYWIVLVTDNNNDRIFSPPHSMHILQCCPNPICFVAMKDNVRVRKHPVYRIGIDSFSNDSVGTMTLRTV